MNSSGWLKHHSWIVQRISPTSGRSLMEQNKCSYLCSCLELSHFGEQVTCIRTYYFSIYLGIYYISLRGYETMVWDRTAIILWQDCMRQDCIHFYDKMAWDRTASIFMTRWYETGLHSFYDKIVWDRTASIFFDKMVWDRTAFIFVRHDGMRQDCIHFYDKIVWDRTASIFMTSQHNTGTHPFYIAMYIHIYILLRRNVYVFFRETQSLVMIEHLQTHRLICSAGHAWWCMRRPWHGRPRTVVHPDAIAQVRSKHLYNVYSLQYDRKLEKYRTHPNTTNFWQPGKSMIKMV